MEIRAKVSIPSFSTLNSSDKKETTFYQLHVNVVDKEWKLSKRFREFYTFNEAIKESHPFIPEIPSRSILPVKSNEELEKRRLGLERYMQKLVCMVEMYSDQTFLEFLEIITNCPECQLSGIKKKASIIHESMAIKDIYMHPSRRYFFIATADKRSNSQLDGYLTNLSMPWDKTELKGKVIVPFGTVEAWIRVDEPSEYKYQQIWTQPYKWKVNALAYEPELKILASGCENGQVSLIQLNNKNTVEVDQYFSEKVHNDKIVKLAFDSALGVVITLSEDKRMRLLDFREKTIKGELSFERSRPTDMCYDEENKVAYIGDRKGNINVISVCLYKPCILESVVATSGSEIHGIDIDFSRQRLFCTSYEDSKLHIFKIKQFQPGKSKSLEKSHTIQCVLHPRALKLDASKDEVYIAGSTGLVSVINLSLSSTSPITTVKLHTGTINSCQYLQEERLFVTASNDKTIGLVEMPTTWTSQLEMQSKSPFSKKTKLQSITIEENSDNEEEIQAGILPLSPLFVPRRSFAAPSSESSDEEWSKGSDKIPKIKLSPNQKIDSARREESDGETKSPGIDKGDTDDE